MAKREEESIGEPAESNMEGLKFRMVSFSLS